MEPPDSVLVQKTIEGNAASYRDLVSRHQDAVFGFVLRLTGNWHEAVDLTQDTFIRAYRKLACYDSRFPWRKWLIGIAANLTKNRFRSLSRRRRMEEEFEAQARNSVDSTGTDPRVEELDDVLMQIPEKQRIPLVMKHMEGYSYEEIARTLRISVSAAKMRVFRARDEVLRRFRRTS